MSNGTDTAPPDRAATPQSPSATLPPYVNRQEAVPLLRAEGLPISAATLAKMAVRGDGCPYMLWNGRALYRTTDLLAWAEKRLGRPVANSAQRVKQP